MAKKATSPKPIARVLEIVGTRDDAKAKLERQIEKGRAIFELVANDHNSFDELVKKYNIWDSFNNELLKQLFTNEEISDEYSSWLPGALVRRERTLSEKIFDKKRDVQEKNNRIESIIERLEIIPTQQVTATQSSTSIPSTEKTNRVFIVHGHDDAAREAVARFLERIGLEAVILHEQANQGRTVIEKVVANSDVGFAVVLLTPDDEGCIKGGTLEPRARQNVLLELGYFIGHLGRDKVCAFKRGTLEIPSDFAGVVWTTMDYNGGWKQALSLELQAAGYTIDWNKIMRD